MDLSELLYRNNSEWNPVVLGGDFNVIRDKNLDYFGQVSKKQSKFSSKLEEFMDEFKLKDVWRNKNKDKKQYTYRQGNPFMQSRLDYFIISENLEQITSKCDIIPSLAPDHSAVNLVLHDRTSGKFQGKRGYWKFNNSLVNDRDYVLKMKDEIQTLKNKMLSEIKDKRVLWDYIKMVIRRFTTKCSKKRARERKEKIEKLEKEIEDLEENLLSINNVRYKDILEQLKIKKQQLRVFYDYINEGLKYDQGPHGMNVERRIQHFLNSSWKQIERKV